MHKGNKIDLTTYRFETIYEKKNVHLPIKINLIHKRHTNFITVDFPHYELALEIKDKICSLQFKRSS